MTVSCTYSKAKDVMIITLEDPDSPLTVSSIETILVSLVNNLKKEPEFGNTDDSGKVDTAKYCGAV